MLHEQLTIERQNMRDKINELESKLKNMESDFAQCARGTSPCFFCQNDEACMSTDDNGCCFKWVSNN
jgi:hypothetical protein